MKLTRRQMLRAGTAGAIALAGVDAFAAEPRWLDVTRWRVFVPSLPSELEGFTIAHLTDIHLTGIGMLHRAIARAVSDARPDLVAITGDVIDTDANLAHVTELVGLVRDGSSNHGRRVLATLGNWEHWGNVNVTSLARAYERGGARLLADENLGIDRGLTILATDDAASGSADLPRALRDIARDRPRLFLTHAPGILDGPLPNDALAALTLAGHTHGGQVRAGPFAVVVPPGSGRFVKGPYTTPVGPAYVSRGIGTSVIPARFLCRPEMPIFTLQRGDAASIVAA
jgi:uncharacterized protein